MVAAVRARVTQTPRTTWWALAGAAAAVLLITSPIWLTKRGFGPDWSNGLWLTWHQGIAIRNSGLPSLYLLADTRGLFEPFFAFYGGPLYGSIGAVSALLGNRPEVAFVAANIVAVAGAYGGMVWLGREIGGSRLARHAGAVVFVTCPYYLTDLYARGAFAEFVALSSIPLALAAGLSLLRGPWRARSVIGFAVALVVLSGSHNLTLVWGTVLLLIIGAAAYAVLPVADRPPLLRLVALVALAAVAVGINSWAFIFNALYNKDVLIGSGPGGTDWHVTAAFNAPKALLDPFRQQVTGSGTPGLSVAAPVWALLWSGLVLWRGADRLREAPPVLRRLGLVLAGGLAFIFVTIIWPWPWTWMPDPLNRVQFPYRLNGYLAILAAMTVPLVSRLAAGNGRAEPEPPLAQGVTRPTVPAG
ncbi:MAG: 6-pyruvoyl-tetrahydropterin synthase related domain rane protein, partial [Conexibacter sp.]|nr:6-pyruvoyl-tetrahydropterin synthase related domain rane protein [Conexibacter sp.]